MALPPLHSLSDLYSFHIHYTIYSTPLSMGRQRSSCEQECISSSSNGCSQGRLQDSSRMPLAKSGSAQTVLIVSWQGIDSPLSKDSAYFTFSAKPFAYFFRWLVRKYSKRWKAPDPPVLACPNALSTSATCSCKRMNHFRDPCSIFLLFSAEVPARRIYKIAV